MKTPFFLFLTFFMFTCCAFAQQHREFAPIGAEWHYSAADYSEYNDREYIRFWVNRDTVVGDKNCRIIENDSKRLSVSDDPDLVKTIIPPYIIYEEDGKVYKWSKNHFYLMYDFNAQLGDTLNLYLQVIDTFFNYALSDSMLLYPCVVIDTWYSGIRYLDTALNILVGPLNDTVDPAYVIFLEFIGNASDYIFTSITNTKKHLSPTPMRLRCYSDSTFSYIPSSWSVWMYDCDYRYDLGMNALKYPNSQIDIYPNPAQDYLIIQFQENGFYLLNTWISINNAEGKTCLKQQITSLQTQINISALSAGVYFIKVQSMDKIYKTTKIIKL